MAPEVLLPTGAVLRVPQPAAPLEGTCCWAHPGVLSPLTYVRIDSLQDLTLRVSQPPRALRSHWASVGSVPPRHVQYCWAAARVTQFMGCLARSVLPQLSSGSVRLHVTAPSAGAGQAPSATHLR